MKIGAGGPPAAPTFLPYSTPPGFRFGGVKAEAGKQAKQVSKCQPSAGERVKGSDWPGFDRTVVPTPRPGLTVVYGTGSPGLRPGATIRAPFRGRVRGDETSRR